MKITDKQFNKIKKAVSQINSRKDLCQYDVKKLLEFADFFEQGFDFDFEEEEVIVKKHIGQKPLL